MLHRAFGLLRSTSRPPGCTRRTRRQDVKLRRDQFFSAGRRPQIESLETRQVLDGTFHSISAANIDVVQTGTSTVTVTTPYSMNDFRIRSGSSRGDFNIQIGPSATDDLAGGALISSVTQNGRDNGEPTPTGIRYGTPAVDANTAGYWVPMFDSPYANEFNINLASGYFPYADGWLGGWLRNSTDTNSGPNDLLTGHPSLTLGTHVVDQGSGRTLIDLRTLGINSQTDGVLLVNGGKNEDNYANSLANADGTWTIFCKDNGTNGAGNEQDYVSFVYVPLSNTTVVAGKFRGGTGIALQNGPFTVTNPATGIYRLSINGYAPGQGVLLISGDGGTTSNNDNIVSYQVNGNSWDILSADIVSTTAQPVPETVATNDPVVSFVFIPGPVATITPTTPLTTSESGTTASFQVVLERQPTADVTMTVTSSDPTEGSLSTNLLTFTTANWSFPQTVTVTGVNDPIGDGHIPFTIVTGALTSTDPKFSGLNLSDISVTNQDDDPQVVIASSPNFYGAGDSALAIDSLATITEPVAANYNSYQLIASLTAGADANDRLEIRNYGTGTGQVGVSGSNVSYEGTTIGSFTGGSGSTPLTITFNSSATPAHAQAVLRAITFRNLLSNPPKLTRTASFVLNGPGAITSGTVTRNVQVGLVRVTELQNGVDRGNGVYTGQVDAQVWQSFPDTAYPTGDSASGLLVDAPAASEASQILLKYGNLFGNGPGQIPLGSTIVSAELIVNVNNSGQGGTLHRMLTSWNDTTDTWNTFGNGSFPRNTSGGVQQDDVESRVTQESEWGTAGGGGASGATLLSIGVTRDLVAWSSGEVNEGWVFNGWPARTDGTAFSPAEAADPLERPRLKVTWVPPSVSAASFRSGVDGYSGAVDTVFRQSQPTTPAGTELTMTVTAQAGAEVQSLLRFDDIIGTGPGQIPAGSLVHAAVLTLASTTNNAQGSGGRIVPMLQTWDSLDTWDTWTNGIQTDGVEAAATFTAQAGTAALSALVQGGFNPFDVTTDLQAWVKQTAANNGWAILPWAGGANDWFLGASDILVENSRPQLRVFYTVPGVTITPTTGLVTSEAGATATFTVQLDTPPAANVTIPLSSSDPSEGSVAPTSLIFTPLNWNIPQTVTITGVDDALSDGNISYSIVTSAITSTDPFYNNFNPADVSVSNTDNEVAGVTVFPLGGLITTEAGGTATFTLVLNTPPAASVTIGLSSSDTTEGTVSPPVVFTTANWSMPQTVTVTGVNDFLIDGSIAYTIITANATSTDANYNNLVVADVSVTNTDNDTAGVTFTPSTGLRTTESGGTATFTAVLNAIPSADVILSLSSSNTNEGNVAPPLLTFTTGNWNVPQTVTITGVNDFSVINDGAVGYAIVTAPLSSTDPNYNNLNPIDVTVTNVDVRPIVALPEGPKLYGMGAPGVLLDFQATVVDLDSVNLNTGTLAVQATAGGTADDRIEVRNNGTGPGQIGVSGANVTFGGTTIGTLSGGVGTTPLVITFNANSTPAAAEALLRAVTFRNVSATFSNSTRTIQVTLIDEAGNTSGPVTKGLVVGMRRATEFQNGNDVGNGAYSGTSDIELNQTSPGTAFPTGSSAVDGLVVVGSAATGNAQVLLRFDSIFGSGPGQIPLGAIITSAYLDIDVNTTGDGPVFRRMLTGWNANTETWNSRTGGIQADNVEARTAIESTLNTATGGGSNTGIGRLNVGVLADLQAWSNGEANNGWAIMPFAAANNTAFSFSPSEAAVIADRPKLRVEWIPAGAGVSSFREGENSYTGAIDTVLAQANPTTVGATTVDLYTDADDGGANATNILLQFTGIIGTAANQVPLGTKVYAAVLTLPSTGAAATPGDGGSLRTVMQPWDATATWANSFGGDGLQGDGVDLSLVETARAGNETRFPNFQAGYNMFDVTFDVQAWLDGTATNNGWSFLPWVGGSDGWAISSSETTLVTNRPKLTVYYAPVGNIAPVNSAPVGPISGFEDTNVAFTSGNAITISDADAGTSNITTTVSVTGTAVGTFTAGNGGGTATATPSNGGATMTFFGPQAQINLALATLVFVPATNRDTTSGTTTVTVVTNDGTSSDTDSFNITLTSVNDAPSFTKGADQTVPFNSPAQTFGAWATAISPGPNESAQTVTFLVSNNMTSLFTVGGQPAVATNGTLTFTPATGASGTATVTITAQDTGGIANGGVNQSAAQTFTITISAGVNLPPTLAAISGVTVDEDATAQTVNLSGITAGGSESQPLVVTASSSNPAIVPNPSVTYTSPNATGSLSFTPVANQSGTVTITVTVSDPGLNGNPGDSDDGVATRTFDVTVNPVNDRPTFTAASPPAVNEDALAQSITSWVSAVNFGPNESGQAVLNYTVSNISDPTLFSAIPSIATNGTLTYTPAANAHGASTFDVTVTDNGGNANGGLPTSFVQTFTITVNSVNDVPVFTVGTAPAVNEDALAQTIAGFMTGISAGPPLNESGQVLTFNITNNTNSSLFSAGPSISSTGTLTYTPAPNANGSATITVTLSDDGGIANGGVNVSGSQMFTITVNAVNDAPSFTKGADQTIPFNSLAQTVTGWATAISAGPTDEAGQSLTFGVTNNTNPGLFAIGGAPAIASNGTLTYTPAAGQQGTATITLQLTDGGGIANGGVNVSGTQTFVITIDPPINLPPTLNPLATVAINEDAGLQTVNLSGITAGGSDVQDLQVTVVSGNPSLIPTPVVSYTSPAATGTLTFTPAANASGSSTITVTVRDAGLNLTLGDGDDGFFTRSFDVNVAPVNDPPIANDTTLSTIEGVAINANFSASDIDSPTLTYSITMSPVLGTISGFNPATGAFTYTPLPGVSDQLDIMTFTVSDGTSTDTGEVRINIRPQTPVVTATGGNINVDGTNGRDFIIVSRAGTNRALVRTDNPDTGYSASADYALTGIISVSTGAGEDNINLTDMPNDSLVDAGADNDYVSGGVGNDTIIGGPGNDSVNASRGNNVIWGDVVGEQDLAAGGDDVLDSLDGNDVMYGGGGFDQLFPGAGNDFVNAGQGNDTVSAGDGDDRVFGGQGNDTLFGDAGNDVISGNAGQDSIGGRTGNDLLIGGNGTLPDSLNGEEGDDLLVGGELMNGFASLVGDANDLALIALLSNWNASHPAGLLSGLVAGDDGVVDSLTGYTGNDDFYVSLTDYTDFNVLGTDRRFTS